MHYLHCRVLLLLCKLDLSALLHQLPSLQRSSLHYLLVWVLPEYGQLSGLPQRHCQLLDLQLSLILQQMQDGFHLHQRPKCLFRLLVPGQLPELFPHLSVRYLQSGILRQYLQLFDVLLYSGLLLQPEHPLLRQVHQ